MTEVHYLALVVGAGPAGMTAALALRARGLPVVLLEAEPVRPAPRLAGRPQQQVLSDVGRSRLYRYPDACVRTATTVRARERLTGGG